jgi:hypothetical protein
VGRNLYAATATATDIIYDRNYTGTDILPNYDDCFAEITLLLFFVCSCNDCFAEIASFIVEVQYKGPLLPCTRVVRVQNKIYF